MLNCSRNLSIKGRDESRTLSKSLEQEVVNDSLQAGSWHSFKKVKFYLNTVQFSCSVVSNSATPWTAACQASLSITNSWSLFKLMPIESVMPSNHLILCHPLLLPSVFPESGSFQISQFFTSGGQSIGISASTSVLPMNIQDRFHLGWTGWISLLLKGLSRVFSNTTVQKHQVFSAQLSLQSNSHIHM